MNHGSFSFRTHKCSTWRRWLQQWFLDGRTELRNGGGDNDGGDSDSEGWEAHHREGAERVENGRV